MADNGNNLLVYLGDQVIAGTTSNEIEVGDETIEVSSTNPKWKSFISGRKEWGVTVNFLVPTAAASETRILMVGQTYTLVHRDRGGWVIASGTAICTKCKITATRASLIKGSFAFKGTGPLEGGT